MGAPGTVEPRQQEHTQLSLQNNQENPSHQKLAGLHLEKYSFPVEMMICLPNGTLVGPRHPASAAGRSSSEPGLWLTDLIIPVWLCHLLAGLLASPSLSYPLMSPRPACRCRTFPQNGDLSSTLGHSGQQSRQECDPEGKSHLRPLQPALAWQG